MYFLLMEAAYPNQSNEDIIKKSDDFNRLIDVINAQEKPYHWWIGTSPVEGFDYDEDEYETI